MPLPRIKGLTRCERGSTAIEYALIGALIVLGMMSGLLAFSDTNNGGWNALKNKIEQGFSNV